MVLVEDEEAVDIIEDLPDRMHTFHVSHEPHLHPRVYTLELFGLSQRLCRAQIERGNAVLKLLHDRNFHCSEELYRAFLRLVSLKHSAASRGSPSGCPFSNVDPPKHMREWMLEYHVQYMREWMLEYHVQYSRNCTAAMRKQADIRREQAQHHSAELNAEISRLEKLRSEEAKRVAKTHDFKQGFVRTGPCPDVMTAAEVLELKSLVSSVLFADGASTVDEVAQSTYGEVGAALRPDGEDATRLRLLINRALADCNKMYDEWAVDFTEHTDNSGAVRVFDDPLMETGEGSFIESLCPDDGSDPANPCHGWPGQCFSCADSVPCAPCRLQLGPEEQLTAAMLDGVGIGSDAGRRWNKWTREALFHALGKRQLQRHLRTEDGLSACNAAGVWDTAPSSTDQALPFNSGTALPDLVLVLVKVLLAEETITDDPWDTDDLIFWPSAKVTMDGRNLGSKAGRSDSEAAAVAQAEPTQNPAAAMEDEPTQNLQPL